MRQTSLQITRCALRPSFGVRRVSRSLARSPPPPRATRERVVVIGAGVIGLSCALALAETELYDIVVVAEKFSPDTTSDVAAAFWYPFLVTPRERADAWALATYTWFVDLISRDGPRTSGVEMRRCREFLKVKTPPPSWSSGIDYFAELRADDVPSAYAAGFEFDAPVIEMPKFLPWLVEMCEKRGVTFEKARIERVEDARARVVVDCCGLGARELFHDEEMQPIRGQVLYVQQRCEIGMFDDSSKEDLAYVIPRSDVTVLGGTAQIGSYDLEPNANDSSDILRKCLRLWPDLDINAVVSTRVGLRPARSSVRLEVDDLTYGGARVCHCVGHGGAGVTLSRGCALEVVDLVRDLTSTLPS